MAGHASGGRPCGLHCAVRCEFGEEPVVVVGVVTLFLDHYGDGGQGFVGHIVFLDDDTAIGEVARLGFVGVESLLVEISGEQHPVGTLPGVKLAFARRQRPGALVVFFLQHLPQVGGGLLIGTHFWGGRVGGFGFRCVGWC